MRPRPAAGRQGHAVLAGVHVELVDIATGHVQGAVVTHLHDRDLARHREGAHRLGVEARVGAVHLQAWFLHGIVVVEYQRGVGDGVDLLAVRADRQ
ncbi:hypothetical protein D3C77_465780 [compost metagenome]